jgi:hypothetical protein
MFTAQLRIVREAIDVVLRRLERLSPSDNTEQIHVLVQECLEETDQWNASPPTPRDRDVLMKRLLALHVAVTNLERDARFGPAVDLVAIRAPSASIMRQPRNGGR